jgi:hypothetical protein
MRKLIDSKHLVLLVEQHDFFQKEKTGVQRNFSFIYVKIQIVDIQTGTMFWSCQA